MGGGANQRSQCLCETTGALILLCAFFKGSEVITKPSFAAGKKIFERKNKRKGNKKDVTLSSKRAGLRLLQQC